MTTTQTDTTNMSVDEILNHIRNGGIAYVATYARLTVINDKTLAKFEKLGLWLLKKEGSGFRLRLGKNSVYLFAGQLRLK